MGVERHNQKIFETAAVNSLRSRRLLWASLMLVVLTMFWGMTFPATKSALSDIDPIQFLVLRFGLAGLLYLPLYLIRNFKSGTRNNENNNNNRDMSISEYTDKIESYKPFLKSVWVRGIIIGLMLAVGFILQTQGMKFTTASRSGFFTGMLVVLTPPLAALFGTSKVSKITFLALIPAVIGIYFMSAPESGGLNKGDILTLICAFVFASQMITLEVLGKNEKKIMALTLAQIGTLFVVSLAWSVIEANPVVISAKVWIAVLYTGIFGSIVAVWLQTRFQPDVPASHAAMIFTLEPVFATLFAILLLGDSWTVKSLIGAAFILVAMTISAVSLSKDES